MIPKTSNIHSKIRLLMVFFLVSIAGIVMRLAQLQIHLQANLFKLSQKNFMRIEKTASLRGNILDVHGALLATNRPVANLYWQGTGSAQLTRQQIDALMLLEQILAKPIIASDMMAPIQRAEKQSRRILLLSDIPFDQLTKIVELLSNSKNVVVSTDFKRHYPHKSLCSHIIGYLCSLNLDIIGKMGIEKVCEQVLHGQTGLLVKTINSFGKNIEQHELTASCMGQHIVTTLELPIQQIAQSVMNPTINGALIVMDSETGALKAVVSRPDFDPALFLGPIGNEQWSALQERKSFLNRAFGACYPPASIFKLITLSAALEQGIISTDASITCHGYTTFCGRKYYCHKHEGHGTLTTQEAVAQSCNILFFNTAKQLDIDTLASYARRFGLGQPTGMLLPERDGIVPTHAWKMEHKKEAWWQGETLSASIGQSYLLATPIQIARMIASIGTGYLVTPRILQQEPVTKKPLQITRETLHFIRESMHLAGTQGTGRRAGSLKDIEIWAKTGTAQVSSLEKSKQNSGSTLDPHAWFVANFQWRHQKMMTLVILIENAGTSVAATQTAREFLIGYRNYMEQRPAN